MINAIWDTQDELCLVTSVALNGHNWTRVAKSFNRILSLIYGPNVCAFSSHHCKISYICLKQKYEYLLPASRQHCYQQLNKKMQKVLIKKHLSQIEADILKLWRKHKSNSDKPKRGRPPHMREQSQKLKNTLLVLKSGNFDCRFVMIYRSAPTSKEKAPFFQYIWGPACEPAKFLESAFMGAYGITFKMHPIQVGKPATTKTYVRQKLTQYLLDKSQRMRTEEKREPQSEMDEEDDDALETPISQPKELNSAFYNPVLYYRDGEKELMTMIAHKRKRLADIVCEQEPPRCNQSRSADTQSELDAIKEYLIKIGRYDSEDEEDIYTKIGIPLEETFELSYVKRSRKEKQKLMRAEKKAEKLSKEISKDVRQDCKSKKSVQAEIPLTTPVKQESGTSEELAHLLQAGAEEALQIKEEKDATATAVSGDLSKNAETVAQAPQQVPVSESSSSHLVKVQPMPTVAFKVLQTSLKKAMQTQSSALRAVKPEITITRHVKEGEPPQNDRISIKSPQDEHIKISASSQPNAEAKMQHPITLGPMKFSLLQEKAALLAQKEKASTSKEAFKLEAAIKACDALLQLDSQQPKNETSTENVSCSSSVGNVESTIAKTLITTPNMSRMDSTANNNTILNAVALVPSIKPTSPPPVTSCPALDHPSRPLLSVSPLTTAVTATEVTINKQQTSATTKNCVRLLKQTAPPTTAKLQNLTKNPNITILRYTPNSNPSNILHYRNGNLISAKNVVYKPLEEKIEFTITPKTQENIFPLNTTEATTTNPNHSTFSLSIISSFSSSSTSSKTTFFSASFSPSSSIPSSSSSLISQGQAVQLGAVEKLDESKMPKSIREATIEALKNNPHLKVKEKIFKN